MASGMTVPYPPETLDLCLWTLDGIRLDCAIPSQDTYVCGILLEYSLGCVWNGSVGKILASEVWGPEFSMPPPPELTLKSLAEWHILAIPFAMERWEIEAGRSLDAPGSASQAHVRGQWEILTQTKGGRCPRTGTWSSDHHICAM